MHERWACYSPETEKMSTFEIGSWTESQNVVNYFCALVVGIPDKPEGWSILAGSVGF